MNEDGKKTEILIFDVKYTDHRTGVETVSDQNMTVWADADMKPVIEGVAGVANVYNTITSTEFSVDIDRRYDIEFVKKEITAAVLRKADES